jgi:ATP adenylyltransferase
MQRLWAPWRARYVQSAETADCVFCAKPSERRDAANYLLHRGRSAYVMLNLYPYASGHLLVIPYRHEPRLERMAPAELTELMRLTQRGVTALAAELKPEGFNVGMNLGRAGGAAVAGHLHIHVVPRWSGDTNFMPVLAEPKVLPEQLAAGSTRLRPQFTRRAPRARAR